MSKVHFLIDESVDIKIVSELREMGFSALSIYESNSGISDEEVLEIANENGSILITEDKDFGELVYRLNLSNHGIVLLRILNLSRQEKIELAIRVIKKHNHKFSNAFTVIDASKIRIRKL